MTCRRFSTAKRGSEASENEDAADADVRRGLVALADGATDAAYSRLWARVLVHRFMRSPFDPVADVTHLTNWLLRPQRLWRRAIGRRPLPWFAEHKVAMGSFAAFLTARLWVDGATVYWSAAAVGDCCLFVVESDDLVVSFPVKDPAEFSSSPLLVGTSTDASMGNYWMRRRGDASSCALFLFMSDALAHWFLEDALCGGKPWRLLHPLESDGAFEDLVDRLRSTGRLRNDDSTLIVWET
jgi:hypothetical protein